MDGVQHGGPRGPFPGPCSKCCRLLGAVTPHGRLQNGKDIRNAERCRRDKTSRHHCPGIGHGRRPRAAGREGHLQDPKRVPRAERLHGTEEGWEKRRSRKRGADHGSRPVALVCTLAVYHINANETRHIGRIGQILFQLPRFSLPSSVLPHRRKLLKTIIWYGALTFF